MIKITIQSPVKPYPINIGENPASRSKLLVETVEALLKKHRLDRVAIVTDTNVAKLYADGLKKLQKERGVLVLKMKAGEVGKTRESKARLEDSLMKKAFSRKSSIIALGGGVVGDTAGFLAATYMRGVNFFQMPTSLLAMVDSSIGGKTGVNTPNGKNMIGAMYSPETVVTEPGYLKTLPKIEVANGMAEVIKYATIFDAKFFSDLEKNYKTIQSLKTDSVVYLIKKCIGYKNNLIKKDEGESGLRRSLNFGHTIAHAFEKLLAYRTKHGFAVAVGLVVEAQMSIHFSSLTQDEADRIAQLLKLYRLPTSIPQLGRSLGKIDAKQLYRVMLLDKKNEKKIVRFNLLQKLGKLESFAGEYVTDISEKDFSDFYNNFTKSWK